MGALLPLSGIRAAVTRITVMQGDARVSADPRVELATVLGSCVSTCLFDAAAGVGGMNHFLLAEPAADARPGDLDGHYGAFLMRVLINQMLALGARRPGMRARLYGGANLNAGFAGIGSRNAAFARAFLAEARIPVVHEDLGGTSARRIDFRPTRGQVRCRTVTCTPDMRAGPWPRPADAVVDLI